MFVQGKLCCPTSGRTMWSLQSGTSGARGQCDVTNCKDQFLDHHLWHKVDDIFDLILTKQQSVLKWLNEYWHLCAWLKESFIICNFGNIRCVKWNLTLWYSAAHQWSLQPAQLSYFDHNQQRTWVFFSEVSNLVLCNKKHSHYISRYLNMYLKSAY